MQWLVNIVHKVKEKAAFIQADVDRKVVVILATASKKAQELRVKAMQQQQNYIQMRLLKNRSFSVLCVV